jgi:predicted transcriptional regulator
MYYNGDNAQQSVIGWGSRGWIEIIENILETCENAHLKTHIMYRCNLNSKQVEQYIQLLQKHNLIESIQKSSSKRYIFKTTDIGRKYVEAYKQLESVFKQD